MALDMLRLWRDLHDLFDTDEGSLPEVHVTNLPSESVVKAYELLRERADIVTERPYFWSLKEKREVPLDSVPNPAALVVRGEAEPWHCVFRVTLDGTRIPDLGIHLTADALFIDYRMGLDWDEDTLTAFFKLLRDLTRGASDPKVALEPHVADEVQERFQRAWQRFDAAGAA